MVTGSLDAGWIQSELDVQSPHLCGGMYRGVWITGLGVSGSEIQCPLTALQVGVNLIKGLLSSSLRF